MEAKWGAATVRDLARTDRALAFQKMTGAVLALEDEGEIAFLVGQRDLVAAVFARYLDGVLVEGPPWRVDPYEPLPTREEWAASEIAF